VPALHWLALSLVVLLCWGVLGVLQKLAMSRISAPSALVWMAVGLMLLQLTVFPSHFALDYPAQALGWGLLNGIFNGLGMLFLLAAMRKGGKAAIVEPLSALYPVAVVLLAPFLLGEGVSMLHTVGIMSASIAGVLLSAEAR
jgi:transporter family protein